MLTDAERKAERESIAKIETYKKYEKHVYRDIEKERASDSKKQHNHEPLEAELDNIAKGCCLIFSIDICWTKVFFVWG